MAHRQSARWPGRHGLLAGIASLPLFPIVGFHLNQARRQFRAGHTLADLRSALGIATRERQQTDAAVRSEDETLSHRLLRYATIGSATWMAATFGLVLQGTLSESTHGMMVVLAPVLSTMLLGALSNSLDVQFIPDRIRHGWQTGVRERLWNSRVGAWFAKRLGAPERSRSVGAGAFRATEAALGVAAAEGLRLDLLRLHAGATDLAPLATLLSAARGLGEEASRLADAQAEVDALLVRDAS